MTLSKTIIRSIRAHKIRFFTIAMVIAIGIASLNGMIVGVMSLDSTYQNAFIEHNMAGFTIQTANPGGSGSDAWIDYTNTTRYLNEFMDDHPQIEGFELRIVYDLVMEIRGYRLYGRIVAFNTSSDSSGTLRTQPDVNGYKLIEGTGFTEASQYRNVCLVDAHLSDYWELKETDFIGVGEDSVAFQVRGILASPEYLLNMGSYADLLPSPRRFGVIFVPLRSAQRLLDVPGKINEISVKTRAGLSQSTREALATELKDYLETEPHSLKMGEPVDLNFQVSYYLLRLDAEEGREFGIILPIIFLGMAMAGLYVLLGRMVVAERKEIGVSQALGYSRRYIISHYVGIAMVIALVGTIIGTITGLLFAQQFGVIYVSVIGIKFPAYTPIEWSVVFAGVILGLLTGLIGGLLPVMQAIQPVPAESLRFDPSLHITSGKIPLVERFLMKLHFRPKVTGFKLPLRNFFRSPRRTSSSLLGIIIAVSIVSMGFGMMDSMNYTLNNQYLALEDWDLRVDYNEVATNATDIVSALESHEEVQSATTLFSLGTIVTTNTSAERKLVQMIAFGSLDGYLGHRFQFIAGNYDPEGVVLTVPIAEKLKVTVGDKVNLELARLTELVSTAPLRAHFEMVNVSFSVSGIVEEMNGLVAYGGLDKIKEISNFPGTPATSIVLKLKNPSEEHIEQVRKYIYDELDYNVRIVSTKGENMKDFLALVSLIIVLMYVIAGFSIFLAVAMVYNTVYINLQERKREIATLLTMGTSSKKLIGSVTIENILILIIGSIIGIIFGYMLLLFMLIIVLDMEFFRITIIISQATVIVSVAVALISVLIAQFFPLRNILNMNLAEATKERVI